jgi:hypothetical protein
MILDIKDQDTLKALEALEKSGIKVKVRDDREVTWIGDSLLQALFEVSEIADEVSEDIITDIPKMASEIEWMLFEGGSAKLLLMDQLRKDFFNNYVRKRIIEMSNERGVVSIFTKL